MVHTPYQTFNFVTNNQRLSDLIATIPIHLTIVDMIYLFLRVTDILFNLLVHNVRRKDALVKCTNESSLDGCDNLHKLESFLCQDCHIPFKFFYCKDTKDSFSKINLPT